MVQVQVRVRVLILILVRDLGLTLGLRLRPGRRWGPLSSVSLTRRVGVESGWGWRRDRGWMMISRLGFLIVRVLDNQG